MECVAWDSGDTVASFDPDHLGSLSLCLLLIVRTWLRVTSWGLKERKVSLGPFNHVNTGHMLLSNKSPTKGSDLFRKYYQMPAVCQDLGTGLAPPISQLKVMMFGGGTTQIS